MTMPKSTRARVTLATYVVVGVAAMAGLVFALAHLETSAWDANSRGLPWFWMSGAALWLALSAGALYHFRSQPQDNRRSLTMVKWIVLLIALLVRIATAVSSEPQLSTDDLRYLADGMATTAGTNPYASSPQDDVGSLLIYAVSHPDLVTIYQPTSQYAFSAVIYACRANFQVAFAVCDLLVVVLLLGIGRWQGRSPWWAALYAFHPLVISEVAATAHQDVLGVALLLCSVACVGVLLDERLRGALSRKRLWVAVLAGVTLAGAIGVKPIVLPIAGLYVWYLRRQRREIVVGIVATALALLALYLPFALMPGGLTRMFETAVIFTRDWTFNSSIHTPIHSLFDSEWFASLVGESIARPLSSKWVTNAIVWSLLLVIMIKVVRGGADLWQAVIACLFASLLLSSTVYPWYLLWALAFVPIRFNLAVWVWSLTITWSYAVWLVIKPWEPPLWVRVAEYAPVYGVLIWMWWGKKQESRRAGEQEMLPVAGV